MFHLTHTLTDPTYRQYVCLDVESFIYFYLDQQRDREHRGVCMIISFKCIYVYVLVYGYTKSDFGMKNHKKLHCVGHIQLNIFIYEFGSVFCVYMGE